MNRFIIRYGKALAILFVLGSLFFLIAIESIFNGGFYFAVKIIALPAGISIFGFTYVNREELKLLFPGRPWQMWLIAGLLYPLSLLFGWPYLMAINAIAVDKEPIIFNGPVLEKFITSGKTTSYHIRIKDFTSNKTVALNVGANRYSLITVGSEYCAVFNRGMLGIPFVWRFGTNPSVNTIKADCASHVKN